MKGLSFLMGALSEWNYGRDPIEPLRFEATLAELKAEIASGAPVFADLIRETSGIRTPEHPNPHTRDDPHLPDCFSGLVTLVADA